MLTLKKERKMTDESIIIKMDTAEIVMHARILAPNEIITKKFSKDEIDKSTESLIWNSILPEPELVLCLW